MTDITDDYTTWDGPYVLGSLTRGERLEYETHLAGCTECRAAVAELAGLPGMLALVDTETALAMIEPPAAEAVASMPPPPPMPQLPTAPPPPPRLADAAERRNRRSRWTTAGVAVAAAAAAVAIAVPIAVTMSESERSDTPDTTTQAFVERPMDPLEATPVSANFKLFAEGDQTRLVMTCSYPPGEQQRYNWDLALYVTRTNGQQQRLDQWPAGPGTELTIDRTIDGPPDQVRSVEIRAANTGRVLLAGTV
ncbi:zf-HC2 domain-containing protein [Nocardia amamiensis]|uniref:Zf-HC2 domain-containing protein n=1 Tax=Nocardia amamiensis TaxID=404578 RepID=A0ABS0CMY0_9NOCA|nr:zf-HC2 domain-containing protein [Nocardia amamiensis]MBF6296219.1 zf-HC2 domain-containing protein [Nocardia amamiensis]